MPVICFLQLVDRPNLRPASSNLPKSRRGNFMAGVLGSCSFSLFRPLQRPRSPRRCFMVSAELSESSAPSPSSAVVEGEGGSSSSLATFPSSPPLSFSPAVGFKPPQPKPFSVRSDKFLDILGASLALPFRLGTGAFVQGYSASLVSKDQIPPNEYALSIAGFKLKETSRLGPRPEKPIEIYEFERLTGYFSCPWTTGHKTISCPFCRKVREIVSILDLDILFYPCPKNGPNFRPKVLQMGGKQQFPYMDWEGNCVHEWSGASIRFVRFWSVGSKGYLLNVKVQVDPNTGVSMYESDDIIKYLVTKYGKGQGRPAVVLAGGKGGAWGGGGGGRGRRPAVLGSAGGLAGQMGGESGLGGKDDKGRWGIRKGFWSGNWIENKGNKKKTRR
ncbi:hypothetical protein M5K25_000789 [Dendrobium thyrsiflorum]|uniref:GST N-terminal domain-containing protein n=1 Tax=Dendrobium thyrsiflorum TaxID=117978 RepID=A0ABD0VUG7_DENTH